MKKKIILAVLAAVAALAIGVVGFVGYSVAVFPPTYPDIPAPDLQSSKDPAVIARGEYLFHAVAHCDACHTKWEAYAHNEDPSQLAPSGGHEWVFGPMGTLRSANITSDVETGIGGMSDGDLARILKWAVRPDGQPAVLMVALGPMADEDIVAIMSYVRTIPPVRNETPRSEFSTLGKTMLPLVAGAYLSPKPDWEVPTKVEAGGIDVGRGRYLANGPAFCFLCHSQPQVSPELGIIGPRFAGCTKADPDPHDPEMEICAPNLTSDPETGILEGWTEDRFVARLGAGRTVEYSPMPWESFGLMTEADVRSIFRYLRTVPPVKRETGPARRKVGWKPQETPQNG